MAEKGDSMPIAGNNENSSSDVMSQIQNLRSDLFDILNKLSTDSEESKNTNEQKPKDFMDKLQSIETFISKIQPEAVVETMNAIVLPPLFSCLPVRNPNERTLQIGKSFVLKHVFKNFENFKNDTSKFSRWEDHFGVVWTIQLMHKGNDLAFYLHVEHPGKDWEIETENELKIIGPTKTNSTRILRYCFKENAGRGYHDFSKWDQVMKSYLFDGSLTAEAHVKIIQTKGLRKKKFRSFDESVKEVSDIVLVVKDRKFHVNKTYLAVQSSFFKAVLLGNFSESKKSEVTLTGIDPDDFHFFLEVLYGEAAIDDITVEGIAVLAHMYDAPTAIRRCTEFLFEKSKKTLKKKLQMATRFNLESLKRKCLDEIKTAEDIRYVVPMNMADLDPSVMAHLLKKSLSLMTWCSSKP